MDIQSRGMRRKKGERQHQIPEEEGNLLQRIGSTKSMAQHNPPILGLLLPSMWFPTGDC